MWTISLQDREHACWEEASPICFSISPDAGQQQQQQPSQLVLTPLWLHFSDWSERRDSSILLQLSCSCMQGQDVCVLWSEWSQNHQQSLSVWVQRPHVCIDSCLCRQPVVLTRLIIISCSQVDAHPNRAPVARLPSTPPETLWTHYGCLWPPPLCIWRCCR